ncbi:CDK5 regulatory subunit-associated protein 3 isoform X2 [Nerophis ophidion]|uniref:CDK5 regulatory subunit-associated protein 3 isoform X2 n=1 Tax=Nerophis ophidion TaxID=159077 RepID=UPI002AE06F77|nr:CDK5 regulatory subunit-associated protein 3 isoform X2 [Nerophis ophidion]
MDDIQKLPIDIQTSKLLDWLVDRRHCNLKWQNDVKVIREKINAAMQDMPESEEIKQLLSGSYIHYFHCLRIVEILKGTEASSKNIFGRYSSQRMKDWQEIVSLYEAENIYLAEVASLLSRNVNYEGPAMRKQLAKAKLLQQEMSRREVECQRSAADLRERYYATCKQYGIKGDNVPRELQALLKDLPDVLDKVGQDAAMLEDKIQLYTSFTNFVCEWSEPVLPMCTFVQRRGNATFYEWRTGTAPTVVERPHVEDTPPEALAEDALEAFLSQRMAEMGQESDVVAMSQFQSAPAIIQGQSSEQLHRMLTQVCHLLEPLTTMRMQHFFMILASPRYVERVAEMLRQKMKQAEVLELKAASMVERRQGALEEQSRLEPRVDLLAARTLELKKLIEGDISKRYNNRPVNLMGVNI